MRIVLLLLALCFESLFGQDLPKKQFREAEVVNLSWVKKTKIGYPILARHLGIEGSVDYEVLVDTLGNYKSHRLVGSPIPLFSPKIEQALKYLIFIPEYAKGKPVESWLKLNFSARMAEGGGIPTYYIEGLKEMQTRNYTRAISFFNQSQKSIDVIYKMSINVCMQMGICYIILEDYSKAIEQFEVAISLHPKFKKEWESLENMLDSEEFDSEYSKQLYFSLEKIALESIGRIKDNKTSHLISEINKLYDLNLNMKL